MSVAILRLQRIIWIRFKGLSRIDASSYTRVPIPASLLQLLQKLGLMADEPPQDNQLHKQHRSDPTVGDLLGVDGVDPVQVEALAEQFFQMFKSTYAAVCARTAQKLLAEAFRIHKENATDDSDHTPS